MDGPFGMPPAAASDLAAVPVDQHEIVGSRHFAEPDAVALHPEAAPAALAHRQMAERHVAMAFHLENPTGARDLGEALVGLYVHVGQRHSKPLRPLRPFPRAASEQSCGAAK